MALSVQSQNFVNASYIALRRHLAARNEPAMLAEIDTLSAKVQSPTEKVDLVSALKDRVEQAANAGAFQVPAALTQKIHSAVNPRQAAAAPAPAAPVIAAPTLRPAAVAHAAALPVRPAHSDLGVGGVARRESAVSVASVASNSTPLNRDAFRPSESAHALVELSRDPKRRKLFKEVANYEAMFLVEDFDSDSPLHQQALDSVYVLAAISLEQGKPVTVKAFEKPENSNFPQEYRNIKDVNSLLNILGAHPWSDAAVADEDSDEANLSTAFSDATSEYVYNACKAKDAGQEPDRLSLHVITRGLDTDDTATYIHEPIDTLMGKGIGPKSFGVQLVRIGENEEGKANLEALDDNTEVKRDQIDTIGWSDVKVENPKSLEKASMGGFNKKHDKVK